METDWQHFLPQQTRFWHWYFMKDSGKVDAWPEDAIEKF